MMWGSPMMTDHVEHLLPPGNQCNASVPYVGRIRDYDGHMQMLSNSSRPEAVVGKMLSSRGVLRYMYESRLLPSKHLQLHSPIAPLAHAVNRNDSGGRQSTTADGLRPRSQEEVQHVQRRVVLGCEVHGKETVFFPLLQGSWT
jgi:hypothetical protein